jgi:glycine cleavage system H lipoate-binding protein
MKYGAMDYVQKPFTEDELLKMVNKFLILRQERIGKQIKPQVHITHLSDEEIPSSVEFTIPGGVFISEGHSWASLDPDGKVYTGIDDFAKKIIGNIEDIEFPNLGMEVKKGQVLFSIKQGIISIPFKAPISGKVESLNKTILDDLTRLDTTTYYKNWICRIDATKLNEELKDLKIGQSAVDYYNKDIERLQNYMKHYVKSTKDESNIPANGQLYLGILTQLEEKDLNMVLSEFFKR